MKNKRPNDGLIRLPIGFRLPTGEVINGRLGEGAYGLTYLASRPKGRSVVVKIPSLNPRKFGTTATEERAVVFYRTIQREKKVNWQRLDNLSCAASVLTTGIVSNLCDCEYDLPYIVQQFIPGPTLAQLIKERESIRDAREWARIARSLCCAVADVHSRAVVHGDIWPPNVILRSYMPTKAPKAVLIDFGQAFLVDLAFEQQGRDRDRNPYRAPECRSASKHWHFPSDIYSLGATLMALATGTPPDEDTYYYPLDDIDEVHKSVVCQLHKAQKKNDNLLRQNEGIAHIIGRCIRASLDDRKCV